MAGRLRTAVLAAAISVAGLAPGAQAAPPAIAGRTVIRVVDGAAAMRITIPRRARMVVDTSKSVRVEGGGRLAGVILREHHENGEEAKFLRLPSRHGGRIYASAPTIPGDRCDRPLGPVPYSDCSKRKPATHFDLRRGTYTLTVFSDGAPARFTLLFENYTGAVELAPAARVAHGSNDFATSVGTPAVWSAGTELRPTRPAELFTLAWWQQDESRYAENHACWYSGSDGVEAAGEYRWLPGCPGGSSVGWGGAALPVYSTRGPTAGGAHGALATATVGAPGRYGVGMWVSAQNVRDTGGFGFWVAR